MLPSGLLSEMVNLTLTLDDGRSFTRQRRFLKAPATVPLGVKPVQVDHKSPGLLVDGIRRTSNGWFNWAGSAGVPAANTCGITRKASNLAEQAKLNAMNGAAVITEQGMHGITFMRGGVETECQEYDFDCKLPSPLYLFLALIVLVVLVFSSGFLFLPAPSHTHPPSFFEKISIPKGMKTDAYERDWNNTFVWLDAAAAVGVKVLMNIGVDKLSSCRSGWIDPVARPQGNATNQITTECFRNGVPQPAVIAQVEHWVFDAVTRLRHHPAVGGYYGCDDCCHVNRGSYAGLEYAGIAQIKEEIFNNYDPYHPMFGTIACGETWMWQEEGFGLGLDVVMKEGYGGGAGGGKYTPKGTPGNMRDYPMTHEPIWHMPDPESKAAPRVLRSTVYGNAISDGCSDNNFYVGTSRMASIVQPYQLQQHILRGVRSKS